MPIAPEYLHMIFPGEEFRALLYGRNSVGPEARSVSDQLAEGRDLCDRHGWPIVDEFKDPGVSASRHARRQRDDFEDLLDAISTGVARIVVAFEASRYYRDLEAYVRIRNACQEANVLLCYNNTVYDLSKREDRLATAMDAVRAEDEVEAIRDRNLRTARRTAKAGRPHGKIPYGYRRDYELVNGRPQCVRQYEDPKQSQYVIAGLRHIDAGKSLRSLVKWLQSQEGARREDGVEWSDIIVKKMLLNRVYLGERLHHGQATKATWAPLEALQTPDGRALFRRVTKVLTDVGRGSQRDSTAAHLLSKVALCGICGDHVTLEINQRTGHGKDVYRCPQLHLSILEDTLDAYVTQALMRWLRMKDAAREALVPNPKKEREEVQAAQELVDAYTAELTEARTLARTRNQQGRPRLSAVSLALLEEDLLPRIEEAQARLERVSGVPAFVQRLLSAKDPAEVWDGTPATDVAPEKSGLTLEQKRQALRLIVTVRVDRAPEGGRRGPEHRVRLSFRDEPGFRERPLRAPASVPAQRDAAAADAAGLSGTG